MPPDDRQGSLQDIHWYDGAWGYFPTYTIGAIAAVQLFAVAKVGNSQVLPGISTGDFRPLINWLEKNDYSLGSHYTTNEVLEMTTGRQLDIWNFKHHLKIRYSEQL